MKKYQEFMTEIRKRTVSSKNKEYNKKFKEVQQYFNEYGIKFVMVDDIEIKFLSTKDYNMGKSYMDKKKLDYNLLGHNTLMLDFPD